jgi:hypothetical protein
MRPPITALTWEIWHRGRRSIRLVLGCVFLCAFVNLVILDRFYTTEASRAPFSPFFGLLMVVSFLLLMGIFNYTEFNSTKEWNGFPYRLFVLPLRTWQLVTLPMFLSVAAVELVYFAWIKLVWTHEQIVAPGWFAVVFGAYVVFYQTVLWSLAGFRITRIIALGLGGVSSIAVACLPMFAFQVSSPWLSEKRLTAMVTGMALVAFMIAWASVARQRCGGGRRRSWIKTLVNRIIGMLPRRTKNFPSRTAALFWFEWRRSGFLLPACTAFILVVIIGPASGAFRHDSQFTADTLLKTLCVPIVLGFAIGKGFIKPEFWSTNLSFPAFLAVKPLPPGEFVICKMKVAAASVAVTWLLVVGFITLWLTLWANTTFLKQLVAEFRIFYPHSWSIITILYLAGFMVLTWRCMVSGLWVGLSGSRLYYVGSLCFQVIVPSLVLLACGIWSDAIDQQIKNHPDRVNSQVLTLTGWVLALVVTCKLWFMVFSWNKITRPHTRQYLLIWLGVTLGFVVLGILSAPPFDVYRLEHLYVLAAFLLFPMARLGLAPSSLSKNRHR